MSKIVLNEKQKGVLQKQLSGDYSPFFASEEEQLAMNDVIDMANDLMEELDAYDELDGNLMEWFWNKYLNQEQD
jgi:hypothetical protein